MVRALFFISDTFLLALREFWCSIWLLWLLAAVGDRRSGIGQTGGIIGVCVGGAVWSHHKGTTPSCFSRQWELEADFLST